MTIKVMIPEISVERAQPPTNKELVAHYHVLALTASADEPFEEVITCRCYMSRRRDASVVYATVWMHRPDGRQYSGSGAAGGHRQPPAIHRALNNAGLLLLASERYSILSDDNSVHNAFRAIGEALGYNKVFIVY